MIFKRKQVDKCPIEVRYSFCILNVIYPLFCQTFNMAFIPLQKDSKGEMSHKREHSIAYCYLSTKYDNSVCVHEELKSQFYVNQTGKRGVKSSTERTPIYLTFEPHFRFIWPAYPDCIMLNIVFENHQKYLISIFTAKIISHDDPLSWYSLTIIQFGSRIYVIGHAH